MTVAEDKVIGPRHQIGQGQDVYEWGHQVGVGPIEDLEAGVCDAP